MELWHWATCGHSLGDGPNDCRPVLPTLTVSKNGGGRDGFSREQGPEAVHQARSLAAAFRNESMYRSTKIEHACWVRAWLEPQHAAVRSPNSGSIWTIS